MITMTDLRVAPVVAQTIRRSAVPASRYGTSGLAVRTRGWLSAPTGNTSTGNASTHGKSAAPDFAPHRGVLL